MKLQFPAALLFVFFAYSNLYTQDLNLNLKLKDDRTFKPQEGLYKKADLPISLYLLGIASLISPMVVFEDKKVYFALTKELSVGKFPYGRLSFEYSYVFRDSNTSHLRFAYNYDIVLLASDFVGVIASPGAGYFTDTKKNGWFLHASAGPFFGISEFFVLHPYFRYRHTFIKDKNKSDINDISLGAAFIIFF